jgi:mono/diheme cytochrome c family protein
MGLALAMMVSASAAPAAPPMEGRGSAERGAFLVQRWCTGCHVAGGQGTDAVPSLATLARAQSAAALRTFLVKPHGGMPDPGLETQGIEDVIAYMETLR